MNFLGGGERHNSADYRFSRSDNARSPGTRSADRDKASPGDLAFLEGRPGDVRGFIHKKIFGGIKGAIGGILGGPGGIIGGALGGFFGGGGERAIPRATGCPPGFFFNGVTCTPTPSFRPTPIGGLLDRFNGGRGGSVPQPTPKQAELRGMLGREIDPAAGIAVLGQFGAGTEPEVFDTMVRRCPRKSVLGADGICYNRGDLRNSDRWWPRGRRPLLTGGDMRAISTASSAAKKLQRKQKQLEGLGLLKRPAPRTRRALPAGHKAELRHAGSGHE